MTTDAYQFWRDALAGKDVEISADHPQLGYYKTRKEKGGRYYPVALFMKDGELVARIGSDAPGKMEKVDPLKLWTWCAKHPVPQEACREAFATGKFPGDIDEPPAGHNSANMTPIEQLQHFIDKAKAWLKGKTIDNKIDADQCQNWRTEILRLKGLVEKERETKIRPHLDAQKSINAEYKPLIDGADAANVLLRDAATVFARAEEKRLEAERQAKWKEEQERVRKEREAAEAERAKKLAEDPIAALTEPEPEPEPPVEPPPPEPVKMQLGGQRGRVGGLKSYWEAEITDHPAALQHYANHPDVKALVQKLAKADVKNAKGVITIPGVRPYEDRRIA